MDRLVVIGNGMAGMYTVEEILKIQKDLSITIFGEEPHLNYNRILLSEVLAGERRFEEITLNTREWYDQNKIDLRLGVRITAIDPLAKTVADSQGTAHPGQGWTQLVITPQRGLRAVNALLTGLHEPGSSHLALLEALAGREHLRLTYAEAIRAGYLWHEFGDLHLILP